MWIVSFITDYPVIRSILKHLDLRDRSPPDPKQKCRGDKQDAIKTAARGIRDVQPFEFTAISPCFLQKRFFITYNRT